MRKVYFVLLVIIGIALSGCVSNNTADVPGTKSANPSNVVSSENAKIDAAATPAPNSLPSTTKTRYEAKNLEDGTGSATNSAADSEDESDESSTQSSTSVTARTSTSGGTSSSSIETSSSQNGVTLFGSNTNGAKIRNENDYQVRYEGTYTDTSNTRHPIAGNLNPGQEDKIGMATNVVINIYKGSELQGPISLAISS